MYKIGVIKGDGIGPEIINEAIKVLKSVSKRSGILFDFTGILLGGASIDLYGEPLTKESIQLCKEQDAILMGSIGGDPLTSTWYQLPPELRPEAGLLAIRKELDLFCNLRPAKLFPALAFATPLKDEIVSGGFDLLIVRELVGGLYFGEHTEKVEQGLRTAYDSMSYNEQEIRRIAIKAFEAALIRNKKVTCVDKANVIATSRLWRTVLKEVHSSYPDITLEFMYVDNAAMQLVRNPKQFDVLVTENMFGDILSDEASMIVGSIGMLPSASINEKSLGLYEPSGGSAPDIAGLNIANPIATILSASMMLQYSFGLVKEALWIEKAVESVLNKGYRTKDIALEGETTIGTSTMGDVISKEVLDEK